KRSVVAVGIAVRERDRSSWCSRVSGWRRCRRASTALSADGQLRPRNAEIGQPYARTRGVTGARAARRSCCVVYLATRRPTGVALVIAYPTQALTNPVFYVKMTFIAFALMSTWRIRNEVFRDPRADATPVPGRWKILGGTSVVLWAGAITAGRLLPYTNTQLT